MNPEPPPLRPPGPPPLKQPGLLSFQRYGCLALFGVVVLGIVAVVLLSWHMLVGTAIPFQQVANFIEKANPNIKIKGVSGNASTGPSVESITWGDDPATRSEIFGLRIKYNGYADVRANKRLILTDVGVRKAHIDLADFDAFAQSTSTSSNSHSGSSSGHRSSSSNSEKNSTSPLTDLGLESFEIRQVLIEDVLITNRNSDFRLSIPKVSWTGFKATQKSVEAGELIVESDRVTLHTGPGRTLPLEQESVTFQKTLTGTAQPLLHPAILQPITFTLDYTFVPEMNAPAFHFSTAEGKVEMATMADGGHVLRVRQLDLPALLDATKLYGPEAADFPRDLVLEAVSASENGSVKIVGGRFRLGVATFEIEPAEIAAADQPKASLNAVLRADAGEIRWSLPLNDVPIHFRPRFSSDAGLAPTEILARVFAGKTYADLSAEEKRAIDARLPVYFSTPVP